MLVMLYAINSVMDSEWSDWVAWEGYRKPVNLLSYERLGDLYLTILGKFVPDLLFLACNLARFLFLFLYFFPKICEVFESLYSLS